MDISFDELRMKEVINISSGKKLGHIIDLIFDIKTGSVKGIVVPGDKKFFKKSDDIFISIRQIKTLGDDVVLVDMKNYYQMQSKTDRKNVIYYFDNETSDNLKNKRVIYRKGKSFIRYRRINNNKYK